MGIELKDVLVMGTGRGAGERESDSGLHGVGIIYLPIGATSA